MSSRTILETPRISEWFTVHLVGRRVESMWDRSTGTVSRWEPLSAAMCDTLVSLDSGGECWFSSADLRPTDGIGPLPSRRDATTANRQRTLRSLQAIRAQHVAEWNTPWPGAEHGKAIIGAAIDRAIEQELAVHTATVRSRTQTGD